MIPTCKHCRAKLPIEPGTGRVLACSCPAAMLASATERAETAEAQLARARRALASLVRRVRKIGGYSEHPEQGALWEAEAVLAEGPTP